MIFERKPAHHPFELRPSRPTAPASRADLFREILRQEDAEVLVLPQVAMELMRLSADPTSSRHRAIEMVTRDPALTAQLLRLANSAYYRGARPSANIEQALARVGDRGLREVLMTASVGRVLNVRGQPELSRRLQARSIGVALAAEALALARDTPRDDVFAAGLLHDVGWPIAYGVILRHRGRFGAEIESPATSRALVEHVHAEVGGIAAEHWRFPPGIVAAISHHHRPEAAADGLFAAWLVAAARRVLDAMEVFPEEACPVAEADPYVARLGLGPDALHELMARLKSELQRMGQVG